jgi:amidase
MTALSPPPRDHTLPRRIARDAKRTARAALIPAKWRLSPTQLSSVPSLAVPSWLDSSGLFTPREVELTSKSAVEIVKMIAENTLSCVEATEVICHRAAVVHQITNCLTEIMFEDAINRFVEGGWQ